MNLFRKITSVILALGAALSISGCSNGGKPGNIGDVVLSAGDTIAEITIEDYGVIKAKLFPDIAPIGVENFVTLAKAGYYDGLKIHRVVADCCIQGGSLNGDGTGGKPAINDMFDLKMTDDEMRRMVAPIGADCPFFVDARPAYATGIGDRLEPVGLDLGGWWLTLVKPDIFVSTAEAYRGVTPGRPRHSVRDVVGLPVAEWRDRLVNDFEQTVFALHPEIAGIKRKLYECGCVYAAMSGSGSSVFGLSAQQIDADFPDCFVWSGKL